MASVTTAYIVSEGTLVLFFATDSGTGHVALITAVASDPTITVGGSPVTLGPATWTNTSHRLPYVAYLLSTPITSSASVVTYSASSGWYTTASARRRRRRMSASRTILGKPSRESAASPGSARRRRCSPATTLACPSASRTLPIFRLKTGDTRPGVGHPTAAGTISQPAFQGPQSWTIHTGNIYSYIINSGVGNGIDSQTCPTSCGQWTIQYDDTNAGTANECKMWLHSANSFGTGLDGTTGQGTGGVGSPTFNRQQVGNTITLTYMMGRSVNATNWSVILQIYISQAQGSFAGVSNLWITSPGNPLNPDGSDRANPFALDNNTLNILTANQTRTGVAAINDAMRRDGARRRVEFRIGRRPDAGRCV